jgi:hypothetical protein
MALRGPLLDPWVVGFYLDEGRPTRSQFDPARNYFYPSIANLENIMMKNMDAIQRVAYLNNNLHIFKIDYKVMRESEIPTPEFYPSFKRV